MSTRLIHRSAASPTRDITECLEGLFLFELLNPGRRLLVVSPWMSDFPALNNRGGSYSTRCILDSNVYPVFKMLRVVLQRGIYVRIACGPGARETELLARSSGRLLDGTAGRLSVARPPREHRLFSHEKALVATDGRSTDP